MKLSDFQYTLPDELIARYPLPQRSASRLLFLNRKTGEILHCQFTDLPELLAANDLLVMNNTKVIPARLFGHKKTGGQVEVLVERILDQKKLLAHVRGGGSIKPGSYIFFENQITFEMLERQGELFQLRCLNEKPVADIVDEIGELPLPPYFERAPEQNDQTRYQTVFAEKKGSVAAPTAGLHFDEMILQKLAEKKIASTQMTLHVGSGTFLPVRVENIQQHKMHAETFEVSEENCQMIQKARENKGKVVAVGTTVCRSLETASRTGKTQPCQGETDIFIYPGFQFHCIDGLVTNFHLPGSTLLMLVAAFAGHEVIKYAYQVAIEKKYRFFSYGDAMLIL